MLIELNAEGTAYTAPVAKIADIMASWPEVHEILDHATEKLSGKAILEQWPDRNQPPNRSTLWR